MIFFKGTVYKLNIKRALTNQYETSEHSLGKKEQGRQRSQTINSPKIQFLNYLAHNQRNEECKNANSQC